MAAATLLLSMVGAFAAELHEQQVADLRAEGRISEATEVACEWASAEPGNVEALRACAELAAMVGRYSEAEDALRSLLFYTPSDPQVLVSLGEVLLHRGHFEEAREQFEEAIHLTGASARAYAGLARAAVYDSGSPGDVLSSAEVAAAIAPDYAPAQIAMGVALRELGRVDEALELLQQAYDIDPAWPDTTYQLGLTSAIQGDTAAAHRAWGRYVETAPWTPEAWLLQRGLVITGVEEIIDRGYGAQYSPDGTRIAYRSRGEGGWGIYTIPAEGPPVETRLWATEANVQSLAWSPDSTRIAVAVLERQDVNNKQQWTRKIFLVPADGGEAKMLLEDRYMGEIAWNPATGRIGVRTVVRTQRRRQAYTIVQIDPETGESEELEGLKPGTIYFSPAWSPDGATMVVAVRGAQRPDGSYAFELIVGPTDDFGNATVVHQCYDQPKGLVFTPDGAAILFALSGPVDGRLNIWAMPADGSRDPVLIDHMAGSYGTPSFTRDGRHMLTTRSTMLARATLAGLRGD